MPSSIALTQTQARQFLLSHQALWPPRSLLGKAGALEYARRVRCIQFDPLDVVGRNADLVLQARVADFHPALLRTLLYEDRSLLDGWDKVMSIYPLEDWSYFRRRRAADRLALESSPDGLKSVAPLVLREIEARGPLSSLELDFDHRVDWPWGPTRAARAALESLYFSGDLVIHHKVHTRKVYDLAQRHIPTEILNAPDPNPDDESFHDWYLLRRIGSVGLLWNRGGEAWLGTPFNASQRQVVLKRLLEQGYLLEAHIDGITDPVYLRSQDRPLLEAVTTSKDSEPGGAAFLAPLDNLLWDRRFLKTLFGFDYRWEVYKPVAQRQYGYYVLPVLYGDRFVARFESVREKRSSTLVIKGWWWEVGCTLTSELLDALKDCFDHFLAYLDLKFFQFDGASFDANETSRLVEKLAGLPI
jgi:uncharacterized protein